MTIESLAAQIVDACDASQGDSKLNRAEVVATLIKEFTISFTKSFYDDQLAHSKLRVELVNALGLDSLPPRYDNHRIFEAIEALQQS